MSTKDSVAAAADMVAKLHDLGEALSPITDFVVGYRANALNAGFGVAAADAMAAALQMEMIKVMFAGPLAKLQAEGKLAADTAGTP